MKLSEAILLGSLLGKQARHTLINSRDETCVFGGALLADGETRETLVGVGCLAPLLNKHGWGWTLECRNNGFDTIAAEIMARNIVQWQSRSEIAAWVASIEPQEPLQLEYKPQDAVALCSP